jgi:uroporphyrinogen-III synthase
MMVIEPLQALTDQQQVLVGQLDRFDHVIFVSMTAVDEGMRWIESAWTRLPVGPRWYAVGRGTAGHLEQHGVTVGFPVDEVSSEGLLALRPLLSPVNERVLIVKGFGGREVLADTLAARGALVEELCVYHRRAPAMAPGELANSLAGERVGIACISSGEGLDNMVSLLGKEAGRVLGKLTLVVPGERVAGLARNVGAGRVVVAADAGDAAMMAAVLEVAGRDARETGGEGA